MRRSVVLLGFAGVQSLDVVGPFDVFTGATQVFAAEGAGYDASIVSAGGEPVSTGTGLSFMAAPLPDPAEPVDTLILPGGMGTEAARTDPEVMDWIRAIAPNARRVVHR